jgi:hypothetical protein
MIVSVEIGTEDGSSAITDCDSDRGHGDRSGLEFDDSDSNGETWRGEGDTSVGEIEAGDIEAGNGDTRGEDGEIGGGDGETGS